jgi:hypothetical protein
MASSRGRPSKSAREQALKLAAPTIAETFSRSPIRQPVDPGFDPYYQRILKGDLAAVLEYFYLGIGFAADFDSSFYEVIGRLVPLQSLTAATQIVSEIARGDVASIGFPESPMDLYNYWYRKLKLSCQLARDFIRQEYKSDPSVKPEELWHQYVDAQYGTRFNKTETARSQGIKELKAWAETAHSDTEMPPPELLCDLVSRFSAHLLVPKVIFFDLAKTDGFLDYVHVRRKKRYSARRMLSTPSSIARKYACAIVGISTSTVSHGNVRK